MKRSLICIIFLVLFVQSCNAQQVEITRYQEALVELDRHRQNSDFAALETALRSAEDITAFDVPMYEVTFYRAILEFERGNFASGQSLLGTFKVMLMLDGGQVECSLDDIRTFVTLAKAREIEQIMCAEAYLAYYDKPSLGTLAKLVNYWYLVELTIKKYVE